MEYMRVAENYPTPKSDKKAIIKGVLHTKRHSYQSARTESPPNKNSEVIVKKEALLTPPYPPYLKIKIKLSFCYAYKFLILF
jgi:hypothetical protein